MSRLPQSMHQGFGGKLAAPQWGHFCITSRPSRAASQKGRVRSVTAGIGSPVTVSAMAQASGPSTMETQLRALRP